MVKKVIEGYIARTEPREIVFSNQPMRQSGFFGDGNMWYSEIETDEKSPVDFRVDMHEYMDIPELTENQPEGNCNKCLKAKDGHCYMMGGKDMGPKCAVWKIEEDKMVPCPKYEEVVEGGLYGIKSRIYPARYYPKVTKVRSEDGEWKYRLYEGNWHCYCEYDEQHIKNCYTHEPQNYDDDK